MILSIEDIDENILYLFTDGASRKVFNEKTKKRTGRYGGLGIRLVYLNERFELITTDLSDYISYIQHTNNDMELKAVTDGLKYLSKDRLINTFHKIVVVTDSDYVYSNWKRALYYRSGKGRKNSSGFGLAHKRLRKDFFKIYKELNRLGVHCDCEWVKGHNNNEFNEKADKSAVAGAQSKTKFPAEMRRGVRAPLLKTSGFNDKIEINGSKGLLIHVTNYLGGLGSGRKRFICEVVDWENPYFRQRFYLNTNKSLSSEFIYDVDIDEDKYRHIIKNINGKFSKKEIKDKILKAGFGEEIFYKRKTE